MRFWHFGIMILVLFGFMSLKLWQSLPDEGIIYPFKYNPTQEIDSQTYNWLMCIWFLIMVLSGVILFFVNHGRLYYHAVFISVVAEFAEYYYRYNLKWGVIFGLPITVATIRYVLLSGIILYYLYIVIKNQISRWIR